MPEELQRNPDSASTPKEWFPWWKPEWEMWWMQWWDTNITHNAVVTFTQDTYLDNQTYSSSWDNEHAILITWWTVDIANSTIIKSWDAEWDTADFYWTNAWIIATDWILHLGNVTVNTNWKHANAVFAYWNWEIEVADSTIHTENDNSWWIMVTWWWLLSTSNVNITTEWNSSAAIRSDRWGWDIYVDRGTYTTNWIWSPAIYSTANIIVSHAELISNKSEWVVVEWKNSVTLSTSTLTDNNTTLNGQSTTYKNIFLYQSMSWDADEWTASFKADWCKIITKNWDTIYVTNTVAEIVLQDNEIINENWDFMRIEAAARGKEWYNWWDVTLNLIHQQITWNIIVDNISSLEMNLTQWSNYVWVINSENQSQDITITLDNNSIWTLNWDSHISKLETESTTNIDLNWYTLYIWENAITSNDQLAQNNETTTDISTEIVNNTQSQHSPSNLFLVFWIIIVIIVILGIICFKKFQKKQINQ